MALTETTLDELVERTCKLHLRDWAEGTATSGSTSTIADTTNRNERDDYWNNLPYAEVYIRTTTDNAAPIGETRKISDFVSTTGAISLADNWSATTAAGDTYSIHTDYRRDEVVDAINAAITEATRYNCLIEKTDETLKLVAAVYEYPVPAGFTHIYKITMSDGNGFFSGSPINPMQYRIIRGGSSPRIKFALTPEDDKYTGHFYGQTWAEATLTAGRFLLVEGYGKQEKLVNNTDICKIDPGFVCPAAAALLHSSRIKRSDLEPDAHSIQYDVQRKLAVNGLAISRTRFNADVKRVEV